MSATKAWHGTPWQWLRTTLNKYPRMRALQVQGQDFTAEIQELLSLGDISSKNLLRLQEFHSDSFDSCRSTRRRMQRRRFDRYTQLPFFLTCRSTRRRSKLA
ncbi:hypothetical protein GQ600_1757 [Phytophthora cactorum]|nr:hypothetical protein GQ600_1757 [Phytophthora cactorum]